MTTRFGPFVLDAGRRQLLRDECAVDLTPKAFDLLVLLVTEAPRVVSKRELHERLWPGTFISDATLAGLIKELRRALEDHTPDAQIIRTAHRVGYARVPHLRIRDVDRNAQPQRHPSQRRQRAHLIQTS